MGNIKLEEVKRGRGRPKLDAHIMEEYAPSRRQALNKMYLYEGVHLLSAAATEIQNSEVLWNEDKTAVTVKSRDGILEQLGRMAVQDRLAYTDCVYLTNLAMTGGKAVCTSHYINFKVLTKLILLDIHAKAMLAQNSPAALKEKILAQKNAASLEQTKALRATLAALDKRLAELDKLVVAAYEDKVKGVMPEALCQLLNRYEAERNDKLEQRTQLTAQLEAHKEDECAADSWLNLIRDYAQLEELDRPTLLRLVKRIEVGEKYQVDGETYCDIKIYYNFVGHIEL